MIKLKLFKQSRGYCGPAALKMVLSHFEVDKTEDELADLIGVTRETGCEPGAIVKVAKKLGFDAYYKTNSSIEELKKYVEEDTLVIVDWFSPEQDGHYSLVVGFEGENIILADPHFGGYNKIDIKKFLNRWFELDDYPPKDQSKFCLREIIVIKK